MKVVSALLLALAAAGPTTSAVELTNETWEAAVAGKTVFIKFLAPWCGHCKHMKPAWDQLMDAFADSKTALVADVDCTGAGQDLCEEYEIQGFPTIKYGDPFMLEDYEGGRDYESLKKFADENLGPVCSPVNVGLCDAATKAEIEKYQAMSEADLAALVEEKSKAIEALEDVFDKEVEKLQAAYEKLEEDKDAGVKAIRQSGLGFMKAVMATNKKKAASAEL